MRSKEYAHDYRYFPDPDLLPVTIEEHWIEEIRSMLPELPEARQKRFMTDYQLPAIMPIFLPAERMWRTTWKPPFGLLQS